MTKIIKDYVESTRSWSLVTSLILGGITVILIYFSQQPKLVVISSWSFMISGSVLLFTILLSIIREELKGKARRAV